MLFYGSIALGLLLSMAGLAYLFPQYGLKLLRTASSEFWALLKPQILKRMPPEEEAEWRELLKRGASDQEIREWQRKRRLKRRQK